MHINFDSVAYHQTWITIWRQHYFVWGIVKMKYWYRQLNDDNNKEWRSKAPKAHLVYYYFPPHSIPAKPMSSELAQWFVITCAMSLLLQLILCKAYSWQRTWKRTKTRLFSAPMQQKSWKLRISLWLYYTCAGSPSPLPWMGRIETNLPSARRTE
jgi:hypothetical protein